MRDLSLRRGRLNTYEVYNDSKEYVHMTETFERCFEAHPEFAKQKKFVKRYKQACKKAGTYPKEALINID